ncbi:MAG: 4'-phosphopantetheinyl transferase [Sandaracinaceae bacterium]
MSTHDPLTALFDDARIVVRSAPVDIAHVDTLGPRERAQIQRASPKRQREFATARALARGALGELGVSGFEILNGEDRAPIWPEWIAGSITHCDTRALVALAERPTVGTFGIDAEHRAELKPDLWRMTLLASEIAWLESRAEGERGLLALVLFSAKEALYKAQYPRSREFMGFHALEVRLAPGAADPTQTGEIRCVFQRDVGPFRFGFEAAGRYVTLPSGELVSAVHIAP